MRCPAPTTTRLTTRVRPAVYDARGNVVAQRDALGHVTSYQYDELNRRTRVTDANGDFTDFEYDLLGRMTNVTDPLGNETTFVYNPLGQLVEERITIDQTDYTRSYSYDQIGHRTEIQDRNGRVRRFDYDLLGRVTAERWYDGETLSNTLAWTYDALNRLKTAGDGSTFFYSYEYDVLDRLTEETAALAGAPTVVLATGYGSRGDGLRESLSAAIGGTADFLTGYAYDELLRTTDVWQQGQSGGNAVAEKHVHFTYNDNHQLQQIDRYAAVQNPLPGGPITLQATPQADFVAASIYGYDYQDRLVDLDHAQTTAGTLAAYTWTFDAGGRLVQQISSTDGTIDYSYDARSQLTSAEYGWDSDLDETYQYDENGNRELVNEDTVYETDAYNRMVSDGTHRYEYDAEGNRTRRFVWTDANQNQQVDDGERSQVTVYTWDHRNRLVGIAEYPDDDTESEATRTVEHGYDAQNRWIKTSLDADGAGEGAAVDRFFVYDGNQIILQLDDSGGPAHRYLWGPAVDQLLADEAAAGEVTWPLTDHLGTIRDWAAYDDDETTIVNHILYDAFGRITEETNPADHLFYFTARPLEKETGLQNNLNRWYEAPTGKWLSADPIGFDAGDGNLYRYVANYATNASDPEGRELFADAASYMQVVEWFEKEVSIRPSVYALPDGTYHIVVTPAAIGAVLEHRKGDLTAFEERMYWAATSWCHHEQVNFVGGGRFEIQDLTNYEFGNEDVGTIYANLLHAGYSVSELENLSLERPFNLGTRVGGAVEAVFGSVEAFGGAALATGGGVSEGVTLGGSTPVSVPAMLLGTAAAIDGVDRAWAGWNTMLSGEVHRSTVYRVTQLVTGSHEIAQAVDTTVSMAGGFGAAKALMRRQVNAAVAKAATGTATGSAVVQSAPEALSGAIGDFSVLGNTKTVGNTFRVQLSIWGPKEGANITHNSYKAFTQALEAQARTAGAKSIALRGEAIHNANVIRPGLFEKLGYKLVEVTEDSFEVLKNLE